MTTNKSNLEEKIINNSKILNNSKLILSFEDSDGNGVVDNPEEFINVVNPDLNPLDKYIIEKKYFINDTQEDYTYYSNSNNTVIVVLTKNNIEASDVKTGQYFYCVDSDTMFTLFGFNPVLTVLTTTDPVVTALDNVFPGFVFHIFVDTATAA